MDGWNTFSFPFWPGLFSGANLLLVSESVQETLHFRYLKKRNFRSVNFRFGRHRGFYGPPDSFEGSGESLVVADPDEADGYTTLMGQRREMEAPRMWKNPIPV